MNLRRGKAKVSYISTGYWSERAIAEARLFGHVQLAATSKDSNFTTIPPESRWSVDPDAAYLHYTANETIGGVEFHAAPEADGLPLVADMSSNILSRPVDVRRFGLIYGSAQKEHWRRWHHSGHRARGMFPSVLLTLLWRIHL